jgi:hypothetical protein
VVATVPEPWTPSRRTGQHGCFSPVLVIDKIRYQSHCSATRSRISAFSICDPVALRPQKSTDGLGDRILANDRVVQRRAAKFRPQQIPGHAAIAAMTETEVIAILSVAGLRTVAGSRAPVELLGQSRGQLHRKCVRSEIQRGGQVLFGWRVLRVTAIWCGTGPRSSPSNRPSNDHPSILRQLASLTGVAAALMGVLLLV